MPCVAPSTRTSSARGHDAGDAAATAQNRPRRALMPTSVAAAPHLPAPRVPPSPRMPPVFTEFFYLMSAHEEFVLRAPEGALRRTPPIAASFWGAALRNLFSRGPCS